MIALFILAVATSSATPTEPGVAPAAAPVVEPAASVVEPVVAPVVASDAAPHAAPDAAPDAAPVVAPAPATRARSAARVHADAPRAPQRFPSTDEQLLASGAVCAATCGTGALGLLAGAMMGPVGILVAPGLSLFGAIVSGGVAEGLLPDGPWALDDEQVVWGGLWSALGYVVVGGASAFVGFQLGAQTSSAPVISGGFGALILGAVGGAVGAGLGTFIALSLDPTEFN